MRMPDILIPSAVAVVLLGLLASLGWGVGDFGGGLASRRGPVLGVLMWSQVASLIVAVPLTLAGREPAMRTEDILIGVLGGTLGASGLALLYRGLSVGRMGVVAPVAAVLTATVPVGYGFLTEGLPSPFAIVGIVLAAVSVVLVSRSPAAPGGGSSGFWYGLGAGIIFGLFAVSVSFLADGLIVSPLVLIRVTSITAIALFIVARRAPWRVSRSLWPALFAIGVMDMGATALYLSAIAIGPLAIAAILASLYPVITTILAAVVLRERVTLLHVAGIVAAGAAVVLIAGASTA